MIPHLAKTVWRKPAFPRRPFCGLTSACLRRHAPPATQRTQPRRTAIRTAPGPPTTGVRANMIHKDRRPPVSTVRRPTKGSTQWKRCRHPAPPGERMEYERALFRVYDKSMEGFHSPAVRSACNLLRMCFLVMSAGLFATLVLLHHQFVNNPGVFCRRPRERERWACSVVCSLLCRLIASQLKVLYLLYLLHSPQTRCVV